MSRFIEEADRSQGTLLPEHVDEYVSEENPVRVIDAFVEELDLGKLATHFLSRTLPRVSAEMGLHVLAYNLKRVMKIMGTGPLIAALRA